MKEEKGDKKMDETMKLTNTYWDMLKSLSNDVKLRLATRLTASVAVSETRGVGQSEAYTADELEKRVQKGLAQEEAGMGMIGTEMFDRIEEKRPWLQK